MFKKSTYLKHIIVATFLCVRCLDGIAQLPKQDSLHSVEDARVLDRHQYTVNPVSLLHSGLPQFGFAAIKAGVLAGGFRRPMQGKCVSSVEGETGGYKTINGWTYNGYFSYRKRFDRSVAWSSVMDPYEGNPFVWADTGTGDWERDEVRAVISLVTPQFNRFRVGIGVDYNISTGARDNDPRPFFRNRDIALRPGITYQLNSTSEFGVSGIAGFAREENEVGFYTQSSSVLLYRLRGFGTYSVSPFVSGERRREEMRWQGSAHYWRRWKKRQLLVTGYAAYRDDEIVEGVAAPQTTGYFTGIRFGGDAVMYQGDTKRGRSFSLNGFLHDGYADDVIFRAESASFRKERIRAGFSSWRDKRSSKRQYSIMSCLSNLSYTDQSTRTGWDVRTVSISAELRYRRQFSRSLHLLLAPSVGYRVPLDAYFTTTRSNVVIDLLMQPDFVYFATTSAQAGLVARVEITPIGSSVVHSIGLLSQNDFSVENNLGNRNHFSLQYLIVF